MLRLFLSRFWPVTLPLIIYVLWMIYRQRKAKKLGHPVPALKDGPWVWAVAASILLAIGGFLALGLTAEQTDGTYIPAHMENGELIPARVVPDTPPSVLDEAQ